MEARAGAASDLAVAVLHVLHCTSGNDTNEEDRFMEWKRARDAAAMRRESDNGVRSASVCRQIQMQGWMDGYTAPPLSLAFLAASLRVMGQAVMNLSSDTQETNKDRYAL